MEKKEKIYELHQEGRLMFTGNRKHLAEMTGLSEGTIYQYCRPGYFDDKKNETKIKIVDVSERGGEPE